MNREYDLAWFSAGSIIRERRAPSSRKISFIITDSLKWQDKSALKWWIALTEISVSANAQVIKKYSLGYTRPTLLHQPSIPRMHVDVNATNSSTAYVHVYDVPIGLPTRSLKSCECIDF